MIYRIPQRKDYFIKTSLEYGVTSFTSATTAQNITIGDVPAGWAVQSVHAELISQFNGTSLATLVLKIGTAAVADVYLADFDLRQTVTSNSIATSGYKIAAIGNHDVIARLVSSGASINAISAGRVDITMILSPS